MLTQEQPTVRRTSDPRARHGYCTTKAACGAKPGARSAGWSLRRGEAVNCPLCLKRTAGVGGTDAS